MPTTRRLSCSSAPAFAAVRQMPSSGSPFHRPFESGGRLYGGCDSAPISATGPAGSTPRMPSTAASAVIPPPTITYVWLCIPLTGPGLTAIYAVITDDRLVHLCSASLRARASVRRDRVDGRTGPEGYVLLRR